MYHKIISLYLLLIFTFLITLSADASVKIANRTNKSISFYYLDNLLKGTPLNIDSNEQIEVKIEYPTWFIIADSNQFVCLLNPNDSANITHKKGIYLFESASQFNRALLNNQMYTGPIRYSPYRLTTVKSRSMGERDNNIYKRFLNRLLFIDSLKTTYPSTILQKLTRLLQSQLILDKLNYYEKGMDYRKLENYYKDSIPLYTQFINSLSADEINIFSGEVALHILKFYTGAKIINSKKNIDKYFTGAAKEFLTTRWLLENFNNNKLNNLSLKQLQTTYNINSIEYEKALSKKISFLKQSAGVKPNANMLMNPSGNIIDLNELLFKNKGKVLLIDFWATWCLPCREQEKYIQQFKDSDMAGKITVIKISLDENFQKWKNSLHEYDNNFILIKGFDAAFSKEHKISTIPRYMVINKNGKIVNTNAPYPSDKSLISILNAELKTK